MQRVAEEGKITRGRDEYATAREIAGNPRKEGAGVRLLASEEQHDDTREHRPRYVCSVPNEDPEGKERWNTMRAPFLGSNRISCSSRGRRAGTKSVSLTLPGGQDRIVELYAH